MTKVERNLRYGEREIPYALERQERRRLSITVWPDLRVEVRAPHGANDEAIERVLKRRAVWILRQQRFFAQFQPRTPARQYVGGETHLYLGRKYRLRIREAEQEQEAVKLSGGYLWVFTREPGNPAYVKALLDGWYLQHARERFEERLAACQATPLGKDITPPRLVIRRMEKRWGSYSRLGTLILNTDLIRAPRACIDYVIMHELCHARHPNHTPAFYKLLTLLMPDWRERKLRLERTLA